MNITPELAAKVLDADLRNIVKKVSDGGILSPSERQMLQTAAFPDSQAKAKRALGLALKYSSGARLTAGELAEVREMHPDFAPEAVPAEQATPALHLTPEPSPAAGDGEVTGLQIAKWTAMYGVARRQIYRWIARGKELKEPCPLDDPIKMPDWIEKHLDKKRATLVEKVAAAAAAAHASAPADPPAPETTVPPVKPDAAGSASPGATGPRVASLDLSQVGGLEGQLYEFQSRVVAAIQQQITAAYATGDDVQIGKLHGRLDKAGEQLRKYELAAEKKAVRMGDYLPKAEVFNDGMQALNTLNLMREQRKKRVRAALADLPADILDRIAAVLESVGVAEEAVFRNFVQMKSPADVLLALAA